MKIVNYATYAESGRKVAELRPAHREYMARLLAEGTLVAAGPFSDGSGALFIYETDSLAGAEAIVSADPYKISGAFASYQLRPWEVVKANPSLLPGPT